MEWKQNYFSRPSVVVASSLHTFIHFSGSLSTDCLLEVGSYTALFANWQIVDTYIALATSSPLHHSRQVCID